MSRLTSKTLCLGHSSLKCHFLPSSCKSTNPQLIADLFSESILRQFPSNTFSSKVNDPRSPAKLPQVNVECVNIWGVPSWRPSSMALICSPGTPHARGPESLLVVFKTQ